MKKIVLAVIILAVALSGCVENKKANEVTFLAPDGVQINASYFAKSNMTVILIHEYNGNRRQWDNFVPVLLANNYSVLTYDMRALDESNYEDSLQDLAGAVYWVKNNTNSARIFVIGASFGGNVAFVSSSFSEISASVAISPIDNKKLGSSLSYFRPHNVLFMSDIEERQNAEFLYGFTIPPKDLKIYGGTAHGIEMLQNRLAVDDILSWLKKY